MAKKTFDVAGIMDDMVGESESSNISRISSTQETAQSQARQEKILEEEKKVFDRDLERPNKRNIGFDNVTWRKIKKILDWKEIAGEKTTQQDVIYDAVVYWLDHEFENLKEKYSKFDD